MENGDFNLDPKLFSWFSLELVMVYHSPVFFFLFALFFYSHFNGAFDDAEHSPIGIQDRAKLLSATDQCVLRYLGKMNGRKVKKILVKIYIRNSEVLDSANVNPTMCSKRIFLFRRIRKSPKWFINFYILSTIPAFTSSKV
ncbi:hypothetical protein B9Z55_011984 [Caenorhabditis nigoni]|uniref:Uncharacterized protein n=1 Tax=Caenorhabditis nigoni TaxID=1611254 RepID=A0A2G5TV77_9PELO|nr:hypothetical protein B9Z55_011984 [Caenorhabditis nigoni]